MAVELHGNVDLAEGETAADFGHVFDAFCAHLLEMGYAILWSFAQRVPHAGYDNTPPETARFYLVETVGTAEARY